MKIRKEVSLSLAVIGLLSYAACTAEKKSLVNAQVPSDATEEKTTQEAKRTPKLTDGVYSTDDHLQPIYFGLNQSKLSGNSLDIVKSNAEWFKTQPPYLVRIIGFADQRGSHKKNERLAQRRAQSLLEAYAAEGISKDRVSIVTRGAEEASCSPVTEDCLAKSRRSETLVENKSLASR